MYQRRAKLTNAYKAKLVELEDELEEHEEHREHEGEQQEISIEVELIGCPRPEWHHLLIFQVPLAPYKLGFWVRLPIEFPFSIFIQQPIEFPFSIFIQQPKNGK